MSGRDRPPKSRSASLAPEDLWPALTEVGAYERHFNELQSKYRALASTWLLAAFAGMGFVLSQDSLRLPFDRLIGAAGLSVAGATGIALLWILDLMVYHQLLDAVFVAALDLERDNPTLPKIRTNMVKSLKSKGVVPRVVWFYLTTSGVLLLLAGAFLTAWFAKKSVFGAIGCGVVSSGVIVVILSYIHHRTCTPSAMVKRAADDVLAQDDEPPSRPRGT